MTSTDLSRDTAATSEVVTWMAAWKSVAKAVARRLGILERLKRIQASPSVYVLPKGVVEVPGTSSGTNMPDPLTPNYGGTGAQVAAQKAHDAWHAEAGMIFLDPRRVNEYVRWKMVQLLARSHKVSRTLMSERPRSEL